MIDKCNTCQSRSKKISYQTNINFSIFNIFNCCKHFNWRSSYKDSFCELINDIK